MIYVLNGLMLFLLSFLIISAAGILQEHQVPKVCAIDFTPHLWLRRISSFSSGFKPADVTGIPESVTSSMAV